MDPILERYHALEDKVAMYTPNLDTRRLFEAFTFADTAHHGQLRKSGEPYIIHPLAVAEIVADLGLDVDSVIAALLHDCTKKLDMPDQLALCRQYGIQLDELEQKALKLLHAVHVPGDGIYRAIWWHTTGHPDMTLLEKIIYLADYIEPSRDFPGVDELRNCVYEDLDKGLLMGLQMTIDEMTEMGNPVHHATMEARDWLKGKR